jgi:hypothetical protein
MKVTRHVAILPGVALHPARGKLGAALKPLSRNLPTQAAQPVSTHLIVIDIEVYLAALDRRLAAAGLVRAQRPSGWPEHVDALSISRQVLVSLTLTCHASWGVGGIFSASRDLHYRDGSWWWDRLSVALGYFWSAMTAHEGHLTFTALSMTLEAICNSGRSEITHQLAERCAILAAGKSRRRLEIFDLTKSLYKMRSEIVHGDPKIKNGPIASDSLFISARRILVPSEKLFQMLGLACDVVNGVLSHKEFSKILLTKQSEKAVQQQIDDFFRNALLT